LSKHKTFAAHFSLFSGTPVCRGTQFEKHWKDQQWNNPFAICLCRQRRGHEWIASSSLHDTTTVSQALVRCYCHTGK